MITEEQQQIAARARKLATQADTTVIAMRQRGATRPTLDEAIAQLRDIAPLIQALVRYQLTLLEVITDPDS